MQFDAEDRILSRNLYLLKGYISVNFSRFYVYEGSKLLCGPPP